MPRRDDNFLYNPKTKISYKQLKEVKTTQNSCIRYCLGPTDRSNTGKKEFEKINWLPVSNRVCQCLAVTPYNFKNAVSPKYIGDIYSLRISPNIRKRKSTDSFIVPFYIKEITGKSISYLRSKICNELNQDIKASPSANSFKHPLKKRFFKP